MVGEEMTASYSFSMQKENSRITPLSRYFKLFSNPRSPNKQNPRPLPSCLNYQTISGQYGLFCPRLSWNRTFGMYFHVLKRGKFMYHGKGLNDYFRILSCSESWFFKLSVLKECQKTPLNHCWPNSGALLAVALGVAFISSATQTSILQTGSERWGFCWVPWDQSLLGSPCPRRARDWLWRGGAICFLSFSTCAKPPVYLIPSLLNFICIHK